MIWIYGGSFNSGTSSLEVYDGRIMADIGDVVIVSFNYRLKYYTNILYEFLRNIPFISMFLFNFLFLDLAHLAS